MLDTWSDKLLTTMLAAQTRGKAAASGNAAAYKKADAKLRPLLRDVNHLAAQGRSVMFQFPASDVRRLVVADGDAWQVWALPLLGDRDPSMQKARRIADLGAQALVAHEAAYRAAGKAPPLAFQRRADQK